MKHTLIALLSLCVISYSSAQAYDESKSHFLIEIESFTPPTKAMVQSFLGQSATPIQAKSLDDVDITIGANGAKVTLLYFMPEESSSANQTSSTINQLIQNNDKTKLSVIGFSNESRAQLTDRGVHDAHKFPIIPNARMLSEGVYGSELGYPRIFVLDDFNTIVAVLPQEFIENQSDLNQTLQKMIDANK